MFYTSILTSLFVYVQFLSCSRSSHPYLTSASTKRSEMPQPNRNFDPPGQGGFNPFSSQPYLTPSLTQTLEAVDSIETTVHGYTSRLDFDTPALIPQPYSASLMPLSGPLSSSSIISHSNPEVQRFELEQGNHYILSIKPSRSTKRTTTTFTVETFPDGDESERYVENYVPAATHPTITPSNPETTHNTLPQSAQTHKTTSPHVHPQSHIRQPLVTTLSPLTAPLDVAESTETFRLSLFSIVLIHISPPICLFLFLFP